MALSSDVILFRLTTEPDELEPHVPRIRAPGEEATIPCICLSEMLLGCANAIPGNGVELEGLLASAKTLHLVPAVWVYEFSFPPDADGLIAPEELHESGFVPDALLTREWWLTRKPRESELVSVQRCKISKLECADYTDPNGVKMRLVLDFEAEPVGNEKGTDDLKHAVLEKFPALRCFSVAQIASVPARDVVENKRKLEMLQLWQQENKELSK